MLSLHPYNINQQFLSWYPNLDTTLQTSYNYCSTAAPNVHITRVMHAIFGGLPREISQATSKIEPKRPLAQEPIQK